MSERRDLPPSAAPDAGAPQENAGTYKLRALIARWRDDAADAACTDGETEKPCDGMQQCADELEEALGSVYSAPTERQRPRAALRISTDKIHIDGGPGLSREHALAIANDILELLAPVIENGAEILTDGDPLKSEPQSFNVAPAAHQETPEPTLVQAARSLANVLPDVVIESLREEWGNSNVAVVKHWRDETLKRLKGAPARAAEWQPIESAPKDGTEILLAVHFSGVGWGIAAGGWSVDRNRFWSWMLGDDDVMPTHWQPLPLPPGALAGDSNSKR